MCVGVLRQHTQECKLAWLMAPGGASTSAARKTARRRYVWRQERADKSHPARLGERRSLQCGLRHILAQPVVAPPAVALDHLDVLDDLRAPVPAAELGKGEAEACQRVDVQLNGLHGAALCVAQVQQRRPKILEVFGLRGRTACQGPGARRTRR